jgi:hypothetical protein
MTSITEILPYIAIANFLLTWGLGFYLWLVRKSIATDQRVNTVEGHLIDKYEEHSTRLTHIESAIEQAPTHKDLAGLYNRIEGLSEKINLLVGEGRGQTDLLRALVQHHIK